jgi:hypothetical protein
MKWTLAAVLVAMTGCAIDDPVEPDTDSEPAMDPRAVGDDSAARLAIHLVECMPAMTVAGNGPYSVQCVVAYSVSEAGVQIAYEATDASGNVWVSARAAAPMSSVPDSHGYTVFALESMTAPAVGGLSVRTKLVDAAQTMTSDEISATILVRN